MPLLRITNGFERLSDANLLLKAKSIIFSMTDNEFFPDPDPSLAVMQAGADGFASGLSTAVEGGRLEKSLKNEKRQQLIDLLHSLSNYVLFKADGNELAAITSGFTIGKAYSRSGDMVKAVNLKLTDGPNAGELVFSFSKVKGSKSYIYYYAPVSDNGDEVWESLTGTVSKVTLRGLKSCTRYKCKVMAIGVRGQKTISDVVSRVVQ
jgi:hypothetical protein